MQAVCRERDEPGHRNPQRVGGMAGGCYRAHLRIHAAGQIADVLGVVPREVINLVVNFNRYVADAGFFCHLFPHNSSVSNCCSSRSTRWRT